MAHVGWFERTWEALIWGVLTLFLINVGMMIAAVGTNSLARRWLGTWLPDGYTTQWYSAAWTEFQLGSVLWVTVQVVFWVVLVSLLLGVPAAYTLARKDFRGKKALLLLFLLPLMVPPITYGIPLATVMYQLHLAGTLPGVIIANLIPATPFVILVMTPFIEQIDPNIESAARVFGAGQLKMFRHACTLLAPASCRGAAGDGAHDRDVRTNFLGRGTGYANPGRDSLLRSICRRSARTAISRRNGDDLHGRHLGVVADRLAFVNPTQLVSRVKEHPRTA
jgi:putative spermidine/putrescine transport system permease protein